jgi:hypothetical protein
MGEGEIGALETGTGVVLGEPTVKQPEVVKPSRNFALEEGVVVEPSEEPTKEKLRKRVDAGEDRTADLRERFEKEILENAFRGIAGANLSEEEKNQLREIFKTRVERMTTEDLFKEWENISSMQEKLEQGRGSTLDQNMLQAMQRLDILPHNRLDVKNLVLSHAFETIVKGRALSEEEILNRLQKSQALLESYKGIKKETEGFFSLLLFLYGYFEQEVLGSQQK